MFLPWFLFLFLAQVAGVDSAKLVSIPEAARRLGIGRTKLYDLIRSGELESVRIGSMRTKYGEMGAARRLVPVEAIDSYAASLTRESGITSNL